MFRGRQGHNPLFVTPAPQASQAQLSYDHPSLTHSSPLHRSSDHSASSHPTRSPLLRDLASPKMQHSPIPRMKAESEPPSLLTSAAYAFCFKGNGYLHDISVEQQVNFWLPCSSFSRSEGWDESMVPVASFILPTHTTLPGERCLLVGMTTYPRIFGRRSRYVDSEHPTYRPIYDLVDRDIFGANHGTVFPVVVRCLQRQEWRVFTYALVQGEQQGWFAGHKVDPEGVFYFTPYRDIGDQLTNPTDRRKAWFKNIRNVVKAHEMPHVIEENDDDIQLTGFRSLQPASMTNSEENQAREATIQQTLEGELGQDSRSMDETHVTTPWLRPRKRPRASRRRLLRVSPELDTDTSSSSSPESGPSPVREASPIRAVRPVDDSRAMRRGRPVRGRIPMGGSTPNTGSSTTASATASQPPASIPQLDHSCRHGSDTQAEKLRDMLRDHIGSLRGLIRTAKRSDGPASSRSGAETTWLESFHEAVEEMELQRSESDLNTIVEFTHDFQGVLRTTVRRARKRGRTADGLPVANEAFLNAIDEEIENISQARLESGL